MFSDIRISDWIHKLAFALLCVYIASISLGYISPFLTTLHTISLRAFIVVAAISILMRGCFIATGYIKMYTVFMILALISCLYSINTNGSLSSFYGVGICFIISFCASEVTRSEADIRTVFKVFSIASVILMIVLIARGDIDLTDEWVYGERFGGELMGNANTFSSIYMFGASFSIYFIAYGEGGWKKAIYIAAFVVQMLALIVAGGRKYIIVTALVLWLIYLFKTDKRNRRHFFKYTVIGIAVFILLTQAFMNIPFLYYSVGYRFESIIVGDAEDISMIRRAIMIREGIQGWFERPIFGHGLDSFKFISIFNVYSHNNYVELLFDMGLVGLIIYYGYSLLLTYRLFKSKNTDSVRWILLMLTVAIFFYDYGVVSYDIVIQQLFLALCSRFLTFKEAENGVESAESQAQNAKLHGGIRNSRFPTINRG